MLKLSKISKNYNVGEITIPALKNVNLEFRKSEFVSILGPSGCGKTTLLNIIGGLDRYTSGDLFINSKSTKDFVDADWDSYRNHSIGFVFQNYNLIQHQTVLQNVELAMTLSGISKEERRERAKEALKKVGLESELYKKPNQVSGGQMQRVAIARAIVNNPDIILADEPTGALDSETSVQIMNILKEISKDRLIIMVTHNPELAKNYSTRIIRLLDGSVIEDTNPYKITTEEAIHKTNQKIKQSKSDRKLTRKSRKDLRTSMSMLTALSLSFKNLLTKKTRTFLTAFAGSIGIIGICLVLSISTGFQAYVNQMQSDTLSIYPIEINENAIDFSSMMKMNEMQAKKEKTDEQIVHINKIMDKMTSLNIKNNITEEYINNAIKTIDSSLYSDIRYIKDAKLNVFTEVKDVSGASMYTSLKTSANKSLNFWEEMPGDKDVLLNQYELIGKDSKLPQNKNEIVLYVDIYNQVSDMALMFLGLYSQNSQEVTINFDDIIGREFKLIDNNDVYTQMGGSFKRNNFITEEVYNSSQTLKIVGILRSKNELGASSIGASIGYMPQLTEHVFSAAKVSDIVKWQIENPAVNALTGEQFLEKPNEGLTAEQQYKNSLREIGADDSIKDIAIYPLDFKTKEQIKSHLNAYNDSVEEKDKIYYTDIMEVMVSSMNTVVNAISYVLIAFTGISLVVSSIMIGIITYVSVLERTKEIGILRSIGARKKDIANVFNAETLIIGFTSGTLGVVVALLLTIPINIIIAALVDISTIAILNPLHGLVLILISMGLTFISGMIPAKIAAKKDPVVALRTE